MKLIVAFIFFISPCVSLEEPLNIQELEAALNFGMYLDPMEENETLQILKEDSLKLNISTQELIDNGRDLMDILIQRRFEQIEPELSNVLAYFKTTINNTQQLLAYVQEVAPQYNNSVLWRMKIIEEKVKIYLGKEATEFVEWAAKAFAWMSYNNVEWTHFSWRKRYTHGRDVLARLETLSDEAQRQFKSAFPFWTLKKLQPLYNFEVYQFLALEMANQDTDGNMNRTGLEMHEWSRSGKII